MNPNTNGNDNDKHAKMAEQVDTTQRKIVMLKGGGSALIQGGGLEVGGTVDSVDLSHLPAAEFKEVQKNFGKMTVERKGDKITLKPKAGLDGVKTMTVKDENYGKQTRVQGRR